MDHDLRIADLRPVHGSGEVEVLPATVPSPIAAGVRVAPVAAEVNPVVVYLGRLPSPASRRTMRQVLEAMATMICDRPVSAVDFPWELLRYQHTARLHAMLAERMNRASADGVERRRGREAPRMRAATANKYLAGLRGVLREARRLGLMTAEDYHGAIDVQGFRVATQPAGRRIESDEVAALVAVCRRDRLAGGSGMPRCSGLHCPRACALRSSWGWRCPTSTSARGGSWCARARAARIGSPISTTAPRPRSRRGCGFVDRRRAPCSARSAAVASSLCAR